MSSKWLDGIKVASPCHESWDAMTGDERERHCDRCDQKVYDLSGMTRVQAEQLVTRSQGGEEVCVRFRRRADGTILTADCPSQLRRARSNWAGIKTAAASLLALAGGLAAGCTDQAVQGEMIAPTMGAPVAPAQPGQATGPAQPCCDGSGPCCAEIEVMGEMVAPDECVPVPANPDESSTPPKEGEAEVGLQEAVPVKPDPRQVMGRMMAPPPRVEPAEKELEKKSERKLPLAGERSS